MNTDFFNITLALRLARNVRTARQPFGESSRTGG